MKTSANGIALIKRFEGLELTAYRCSANKLTIGYGHTSAAGQPLVKEGMTITKEAAEKILRDDLLVFEAGVSKLVTVPISQGQFDALVAFAFNCGLGAPRGSRNGPSGLAGSTLLRRVNANEFDKVPAEFMKWVKGGGRELPGLVRRRREEVALWRGIDAAKVPSSRESRELPDAPVPSNTITQSKEGNAAAMAAVVATSTAAAEVIPTIKSGAEILPTIAEALGRPVLIGTLIIIAVCAAIWYWRKQRLDEEGA